MNNLAWYALTVRSGREDSVRSALDSRGYNTLLPRFRSAEQPSAIPSRGWKALYPGYLFCQFDAMLNGKIITTPGVISVVSCGRQWLPVDEEEIRSLRCLVASDVPRYPWRYIPTGCRVRIESGPLKSAMGVVVDSHRLVVSITILGRSSVIELPDDTILSLAEPSHGLRTSDSLRNIAMRLACCP